MCRLMAICADWLQRCAQALCLPLTLTLSRKVVGQSLDPATTAVASVMSPDPVWVTSTDDAMDALETMLESDTRHLPVSESKAKQSSIRAVMLIIKCSCVHGLGVLFLCWWYVLLGCLLAWFLFQSFPFTCALAALDDLLMWIHGECCWSCFFCCTR